MKKSIRQAWKIFLCLKVEKCSIVVVQSLLDISKRYRLSSLQYISSWALLCTGLPQGLSGKESALSVQEMRVQCLGWGEGNGSPLLGKSHGERSLVGYKEVSKSPHDRACMHSGLMGSSISHAQFLQFILFSASYSLLTDHRT